jgi:UDP-2-acetamido-2,6-beta-L-arabino-hexul-4-ose reductase
MNILVTGSQGFIAKNLLAHLNRMENLQVTGLDRSAGQAEWEKQLDEADVVFHLAGTNRPPDPGWFQRDNTDLTRFIVDTLEKRDRSYKLIFSSSTQATLDNRYSKSKKDAEDYIRKNTRHGKAVIYRLPGVFGKWCRPNYNSVVATFCYNTANHLPVQVKDPDFELKLVYVDDIVRSFIGELQQPEGSETVVEEKVEPEYSITLEKLAATIMSFQNNRNTLFIPNVGDGLEKALYSTWLTYLPVSDLAYELKLKTDPRGSLFELLKSRSSGQIFISTTLPGITRGNHFHHTKTEKFVVIQGRGRIQFRSVLDAKVIEYEVDGAQPKVVDIPPGYTHNITNTGDDTMITLFWANELFDPQNPDTFFEKV